MFERVSPLIKNIIYLNIGVFILQYLFKSPSPTQIGTLEFWGGLHDTEFGNFYPHQIFTHMFLHGGIFHLAFNMISLAVLGPLVEWNLKDRRFLILFLASGLGAGLADLISDEILGHSMYYSIGASGAVMGVVISAAIMYPNIEMMVYGIIPAKLKYLVICYVLFDLFSGVSGLNTGIAHFAHLGGAATGAILTYVWRKQGILFK